MDVYASSDIRKYSEKARGGIMKIDINRFELIEIFGHIVKELSMRGIFDFSHTFEALVDGEIFHPHLQMLAELYLKLKHRIDNYED